jgi:hypothetical protein
VCVCVPVELYQSIQGGILLQTSQNNFYFLLMATWQKVTKILITHLHLHLLLFAYIGLSETRWSLSCIYNSFFFYLKLNNHSIAQPNTTQEQELHH